MADYRQSDITGTVYRRAFAVHLFNPVGDPAGRNILFEEQEVITLEDRQIVNVVGSIGAGFTPDAKFALLHPVTGEAIGEATHMQVYLLLASLYIDLAVKRDIAAAQAGDASAPPPAPVTLT